MTGGIPQVFPSLQVVIVNFRNPEATLRAIRSAVDSAYEGSLGVLVVENGSGDDSATRLRAPAVATAVDYRLIESKENLGYAGGVALAWREARADLICVMNNDAKLHPEALRALAAAMRLPGVMAAAPYEEPMTAADSPSLPLPGRASGTTSLLGANIWLPVIADPAECFTASGVCLTLRRADFTMPFPPHYFAYYEDVLLGWRIRLRGQRSVRVPGAVIYHEGSASSARNPALRRPLAVHAERNRLTTLLACWSAGTLVRLSPLWLADEARRLAAALIALTRGRGTDLIVWSRARAQLLGRLRWIVSLRRSVQAERRVPDSSYVPLMSAWLTIRTGVGSALLNRMAAAYCGLVGLKTLERSSRRSAQASTVQL